MLSTTPYSMRSCTAGALDPPNAGTSAQPGMTAATRAATASCERRFMGCPFSGGRSRGLPAAAQRAVEIHSIGEAGEARGHELLLRVVELRLRGEHREVAVDALLEAKLRQVEGLLLRGHEALERRGLVVVGATRRKSVGDFPERDLDRFLVLRDVDVLLDPRRVEVRAQRPRMEDRHGDRRHEAPGLGGALA